MLEKVFSSERSVGCVSRGPCSMGRRRHSPQLVPRTCFADQRKEAERLVLSRGSHVLPEM